MDNHEALAQTPTAWQRTLNPARYPMPSMDNSTAQLSTAYSARRDWWLDLATSYATQAENSEDMTEAMPLLTAGHDALARANFWRREADALALVAVGENRH